MGPKILAFGGYCSAKFQPILYSYIPNFTKLKYLDLENIKAARVNTVVFNLDQIKRRAFVGHSVVPAPDWPKRFSNFENVAQPPFEFGLRTSNDARFCQNVFVNQSARDVPKNTKPSARSALQTSSLLFQGTAFASG